VAKRFGLVILLLILSVARPGFRDETQTLTAAAAPIAGAASRPLDVVTSSVSRGLASLRSQRIGVNAGEERRAQIRGAVHDLFDVNDMARRALGQHWKGLGPRQHEEFVRLFGDVLTQSFVTIVERYSGDSVLAFDEEVAGTFAQVRSRITRERRSEITIEYRLSQHDAHWTVYDIVLDGVSLVSNYRSQFNSIVRTSSAAQLLERMETARAWRRPGRGVVGDATTAELETSARGRLVAGLLLSAVSSPRSR
jgi:phospholipid transport system substrate-binding protein